MTKTINLELEFVKYNQAQKEIVVNESIATLDAFINRSIVKIVSEPDEATQDGRIYLISEKSGGEWESYQGYLLFYFNGWRYVKPKEGFVFWFQDQKSFFYFSEGKWLKP